MSNEIRRDVTHFYSEKFDCSAGFLLKELAQRAAFWCRNADGSYDVPTGQDGQIYEMAIAAHLKITNAPYWRDLYPNEPLRAGDRYFDALTGQWIYLTADAIPSHAIAAKTLPVQRAMLHDT